MNEPWIDVSSTIREADGLLYRSTIARDRVGFRQVRKGSAPINNAYQDALCGKASRHVVLVEDSDDDAMLFDLGVRGSGLRVETHRARSVYDARELLAGNRPALVTLDCHLAGESGLDLLSEIRALESFRPVPIVMMSGSESEDDVRSAFARGANSFLRKPFDCEQYVKRVGMLVKYWLDVNCSPLVPEAMPSCIWLG
jgi:CheY-like chemotaxis protein